MLWLKAFHIIFVVCWFAGLLYLPRIFVYYAASENAETRQQLAVMARRLYRFVTPFMFIAIALGIVMLTSNPAYYLSSVWMLSLESKFLESEMICWAISLAIDPSESLALS